MCGIVSLFAYGSDAPPVDREELFRIRDRMVQRGPDGCGAWFSADHRVGLGHRRLAIIDLSATGAQPMASEDGSLVVTFNGEIYNYRELRDRLERKGYRFSSTSDTEVLLRLYADKGREMVHDLRGMYAFAIWDEKKKGLFLARDPFGIKPLYYADDGKTFRAASQVKALVGGGKIETVPEPAGHVGFFLWGHVPEPYTLYRGIRSLPAGSWLWVPDAAAEPHAGTRTPHTFCSITDELRMAEQLALSPNGPDWHAMLHETLLDSVRRHLVADVPVGVFLSAGLDSTTLTALAAECGTDELHTVTLGFREYRGTRNDETLLAEAVARQYGTVHRTIWVEKADFLDEFGPLLEAMDQPTIDGVNSYFVSKAAVQAGLKVAISGLGGDELFGSYPSFSQIPRMVGRLGPVSAVPALGKLFRAVSAPLMKWVTSPKYAGLLEYGGSYGGAYLLRRGMFMPWELPEFLDGDLVREGWRELQALPRLAQTMQGIGSSHLRISALEMSWYMRNQLLRDTDWASMAHSLEIRVPLVDIDLVRAVAPLFTRNTSPNKRDMASTPLDPLPEAVIGRGKTGFSVPVREWLTGDDDTAFERRLRGWSKKIYRELAGDGTAFIDAPAARSFYQGKTAGPRQRRVLALVPDAFGGHGGIALYNRDLLTALCGLPDCREVVALPRLMPNLSEPLPAKLTYLTDGINSKIRYVTAVVNAVRNQPDFDLIICGHINLLPFAQLLRYWLKAPVLLEVYGIDAWEPTSSLLSNNLVHAVDAFVSISDITRQRFLKWTGLEEQKGFLLPNAIHEDLYGPAGKSSVLLDRYGLHGKTVLLTLGRLVSQERYKGFDEVLDLLPELAGEIPGIAYLIVGDGSDRQRLEQKAGSLGIADRVIFTGLIPEAEKSDHYRLADAYVMPSRGEGFGFVFLEAMACGIPVVASKVDGSREAVRDGELGILVDPAQPEEIKAAILQALRKPKGKVPEGLEYFSFENYTARLRDIVEKVMGNGE